MIFIYLISNIANLCFARFIRAIFKYFYIFVSETLVYFYIWQEASKMEKGIEVYKVYLIEIICICIQN